MKIMRTIIFVIIGIVLLGCIGLAVAYFTTDIFKSNQDIFYKYLSREDLSNFFDTNTTKKLINKMQNEPNESNGKIIVSANIQGEEVLQNSKIVFNNKLDNLNNLFESQINFNNKENKNLLKLNILKNDNTYGAMVDGVITQYLAVENNYLKKLTNKLGFNANTLNIPDKIDFEKYIEEIILMQDDLENFCKNIYGEIINQAKKENYTKTGNATININENEIDVVGYELNLTKEDFNNILNKVIENENYEEELFNFGKVLNFLADFFEKDEEEFNFTFTYKIYVKDESIVKQEIIMTDVNNQTIKTNKTNGNLIINLQNLDETEYEIQIDKITAENLDEATYNLNISVKDMNTSTNIDIKVELNTVFNSDFTITKFDDKNRVIANNMEAATLVGVVKIIGQKIYNETKFRDTVLGKIYDIYILKNDSIMQRAQESMDNAVVGMHNSMFKQYEGEQDGTAVKSLINIIETNNATSGNTVVDVLYNDLQEQIEINANNKYDISFKYNEEGYIDVANINEK